MLADTVGYAHPAQIKEVVRATREAIGDTLYGLHLHDTCGLGIANALGGLEEGIRAFDSCLAGLGGCPYAPAPRATSSPRTWCSCWRAWASPPASTWRS